MGRIDGRYDNHGITNLLGISSVSSYDTIDLQAPPLRFIKSTNQVDTDRSFRISAPNREDKYRIIAEFVRVLD